MGKHGAARWLSMLGCWWRHALILTQDWRGWRSRWRMEIQTRYRRERESRCRSMGRNLGMADDVRVRPPGIGPQGAVLFLNALTAPGSEVLARWCAGCSFDLTAGEWLAEHGLAPYAFYRLREAGVLGQLGADTIAVLRAAYYKAVADTELHNRELATVLAALAHADVTPILFKGAVLAHTVYGAPFCRPMGDLDLWLTDEEMPRAQAALETVGYVQHIKAARPLAMQAQRSGEIQLVGRLPGSGLIELHWGVFAGEWLSRTASVDQAGIRDRAVPVAILGQPALTMAAEDAVIQSAVHLAINHQMAYPGLRALLDIRLLAGCGSFDWAVAGDRAHAWRVGHATWLVLFLADQVFGLPGARPVLDLLQPSAIRQWSLARFTGVESLLARRDLTGTPLRLLYQLLMVDHPSDAARLVARACWPEHTWLVARYGQAGVGLRCKHALRALRGKV